MGLVIPLTMGIGDVLIELFVKVSSVFKSPINETSNLMDMIFGITWIQFVNLGFILIFVSIKIKFESVLGLINFFGIFKGEYNTFNSEWYFSFGATITQTLMI